MEKLNRYLLIVLSSLRERERQMTEISGCFCCRFVSFILGAFLSRFFFSPQLFSLASIFLLSWLWGHSYTEEQRSVTRE